MTTANTVQTGDVRLWLIENRAGPPNEPAYEGCWKAGSLTVPKAEPKPIYCPDPAKYGAFKVVDKVPGEIGLPGFTVTARYQWSRSALLNILQKGCDVDIQVHMGKCKDPQDFNAGWEKIGVLEAAQGGDYSVAEFGAMEPSEQAAMNEEMPFKGENFYEILKMAFEEHAEAETVQEIIAIMICDAVSCGSCGTSSNGCDKVFALTKTVGGSPGAKAEVIFTANGGIAWGDTEISTLLVNKEPIDMACVGTLLVVISNTDDSLHYAIKAEILAGTETWTKVTTGIVAAGSPNAIFSLSPRHTWVVGDGGYVYFTDDPTIGLTVQTAGTVTTQILYQIHGYDVDNLVAVGAANAVIYTTDGGDTWVAVTGPNPAVVLTCVWMRSVTEWFVGCADGKLYYTTDAGVTWVQKQLPGQAALTRISDIKFSTDSVGWVSARTATPAAKIFRTIDGGYSWYLAPESGVMPVSDYINEIAICPDDANIVYAGGLADDAADGIILKGSS